MPTVVVPPMTSRPVLRPETCWMALTASSASRKTRRAYSIRTSPSAVGRIRAPERSIRVACRERSSWRTWFETDGWLM